MNILVISFRFPPMDGIASRRWAKFSKVLANKGYTLHVITASHRTNSARTWERDIINDNIHVHSTASHYPVSIIESSKYAHKVIKKILSITTHKMDYAEHWGKNLIGMASKLIEDHKIRNVIVTSPPFSVAYYSAYLKVQYPEINLIQDFRDNWNDDPIYQFPNSGISFRQKEKLAYKEMFVANHCDYLLNVTNDLSQRYKNKYPHLSSKFRTIYNGFDKDDIPKHQENSELSGFINVIYAGSLGGGRLDAVDKIARIINDTPSIGNKIRFKFYTNLPLSKLTENILRCVDNNIMVINGFISPDEVYSEIQNSDVCLSINSSSYPYAFGTKIFDYMNLGKRIFHISNGGELYDLLKDSEQFVSTYDRNSLMEQLSRVALMGVCLDNNATAYSGFDIVNITKEIEKLLI